MFHLFPKVVPVTFRRSDILGLGPFVATDRKQDYRGAVFAKMYQVSRSEIEFAEHLPERRKMMQAWADYLDGLKAGAEVIPLCK